MARAPRPDDPAAPGGTAPSLGADEAQAAPAAHDPAQMPLFRGDGPASPRVRRARLRARIKALLGARLKRRSLPAVAAEPTRPPSSWPDSFFDGHDGA